MGIHQLLVGGFFECSGQPQNSTYVLAPYQPIQKPPQHPKTPKPSSNCVDASCQPAFSSMLDASKKGFVGQSLVPGNGSCRRQASQRKILNEIGTCLCHMIYGFMQIRTPPRFEISFQIYLYSSSSPFFLVVIVSSSSGAKHTNGTRFKLSDFTFLTTM